MHNDFFVRCFQKEYNNGNFLKGEEGIGLGRAVQDKALLIEIELKRKQMIQSGLENGLQSDITLELSMQVDRLINAFEQSQNAKIMLHMTNENNF